MFDDVDLPTLPMELKTQIEHQTFYKYNTLQ
jgi:hypothetical protein